METTITQMIWDKINEIQREGGNYDPVILSEQIIDLSRLYANLTDKIADFEHDYQIFLGMALDKDVERPYNKVELEARRGEEYYRMKKALALEKSCIQIIRATNRFIKLKEHEQETTKYT